MSKKVPGAELGQSLPKMDASTADPSPSEWETKDHLDTLMKAHEIMGNPVKLKAVHALAGRHAKAIKSIGDIKAYTQAKYGPKQPGLGALKGDNEDEETASEEQGTGY